MITHQQRTVYGIGRERLVLAAHLINRDIAVELDEFKSLRSGKINFDIRAFPYRAADPVRRVKVIGGIRHRAAGAGKIPDIRPHRRRTRQTAEAQSRKQQNNRHVLFFHDHITFPPHQLSPGSILSLSSAAETDTDDKRKTPKNKSCFISQTH